MKIFLRVIVMPIVVITLDQLTKYYVKTNFYVGESVDVISNFFSLTYVRNSGAAFGMFADSSSIVRQVLLILLPVAFGIYLIYSIWTTRKNNILLNLSFCLILAGGVGNLIDRISDKYVVDFFDFFIKNSHWPAFNIADSAITIGASLFILDSYFHSRKLRKKITNESSAEN